MNRSIEFRAWDFDIGEMFYNYQYNIGVAEQNKYPLMQKTGIKDIKGKDIFEGDIIKANNMYNDYIVFKDGAFNLKGGDSSLNLLYQLEQYGNYQVLGNIYENANLLVNESIGLDDLI